MATYTARMATTLAINTQIILELNSTGQDIANNKTNFSYTIKISKVNNWNDNFTGTANINFTVGGVSVLTNLSKYWTIHGADHNHTATTVYTLATGTFSVPHNADGTKTADVSLVVDPNVAGVNWGTAEVMSISTSLALTAIPRSSSFTLASTMTSGSNYTMTITRASSAFTHTISRIVGGTETNMVTGATTSAVVNMPHSIFNDYPSSSSVAVTIMLKTYSGATLIGSQSLAVTVNLVSSAIPTVGSLAYSNSNSAGMATTELIRGVSALTLTAGSVAGSYSSTISNYEYRYLRATGAYEGAATSSTNTHVYNNFNFPTSGSETFTCQVRVKDSRGRYSAWRNATVLRMHYYQAPSIGNMTVRRAGATNTTLQVTRNYVVTGLYSGGGTTNSNTANLSFQTRPLNGTTSNNTGATSTTLTLTNSTANLAGTFSASASFEVRAILADKINTITGSWIAVGTEFVPLDIGPKGAGIGKIHSDSSYHLEVGTGGLNSEGTINAPRYNHGANWMVANGYYSRLQNAHGYIEFGPANTSWAHIYTDRPEFYFNKEIRVNGHKVWNANNDGSGTGLDADLLDGKHASAFALANHTHAYAPTSHTHSEYDTTYGTNTNGKYWRSGNMQTCVGKVTLTGGGNGYYYAGTWTFPASFYSASEIYCSANVATVPTSSNYMNWNGNATMHGPTTTGVSMWWAGTHDTKTLSGTVTLDVIAVGRWKA